MALPATVLPESFSAATTAARFENDLRNVCGAFDVRSKREEQPFEGQVGVSSKAGLDFAFVGQNATRIERTEQNIRRDPGNHYFLIVQDVGSAIMRQSGTETALQPGDMFLADSTAPSIFHYGDQISSQVSLHLPREDTEKRFGRRVHGGIAFPRHDPLCVAIRSILAGMLKDQTADEAHVIEAFHGVFGAFLFNRSLGETAPPNPNRQLVNRCTEVMARHYRDPDITVADIANLAGMSLRQAQRAFAFIGETPRQRLQQMRLNAASERIDRLEETSDTIAAIAFSCGFNDLSTFYRQYKTRYGSAPGDHCRLMQ